jgi:hypothetical protein
MAGTIADPPGPPPVPAPWNPDPMGGSTAPPEPYPAYPTSALETPRRRSKPIPVVVIVVIVVVVVGATLAFGIIRWGGGSTSTASGGAALNYSAAYVPAASMASSQPGSPWKESVAFGTIAPFSTSVSANSSSFGVSSNCTPLQLDIANHSAIAVSGSSDSLTSGEATLWVFAFLNASGTLLLIADNGGDVFELGSMACSGAGVVFGLLAPVPSNASSAEAAAAAWSDGGSVFASAHPGSEVGFELAAGISFPGTTFPAKWFVAFAACTASDLSTGASAPVFAAQVDVSSDVATHGTNSTASCEFGVPGLTGGTPTGTGLGSTFAWGTIEDVTGDDTAGCPGIDQCYTLEISRVGSNLTPSDLAFSARTGLDTAITITGWTFTLVSIQGLALAATWSGPGRCSGSACSTPLVSGDAICLDTGATVSSAGDTIWANGVGSYSGTAVSGPLPE